MSALQPFIGEVACVGFNFAPKGWVLCQGQLLSIKQYQALFALLGTQYGGDGINTFAVPDLRGRIPLGAGQAPGMQSYVQGQKGGFEGVSLSTAQLPAHTHAVTCDGGESQSPEPSGNLMSVGAASYASSVDSAMGPSMLPPSGGGSQPHPNLQPFLTINWIMATMGIFPPHQ